VEPTLPGGEGEGLHATCGPCLPFSCSTTSPLVCVHPSVTGHLLLEAANTTTTRPT
jgi:hypothetical protein